MEETQLRLKYADIFDNLSDYVLVGTEDSFVILKVSTMNFCLIEEDYLEIKNLMVKMGVRFVNDAEDVRPNDFVKYHNVWDEELKIMRKVSQSEFDLILAKRSKRKK